MAWSSGRRSGGWRRRGALEQREIHRRTGAAPRHDPHGRSPRRAAQLRPAAAPALEARSVPREIRELLEDEPTLSGVRIREEIAGARLSRRQDDPRRPACASCARATCRRRAPTSAPSTAPASSASSTSASRRREIPVGHGQTRRGCIVTAELPYSRAFAGALVFSKSFADIAWGMSRCLDRLGALPEKLVWDREGAIHAAAGARPRPSSPSAVSSPSAGSSSMPATARPRARSSAPTASCTATSRPAGASPTRSTSKTSSTAGAIGSTSASTAPRGRSSAERLAAERERMRPAARARCPTPTGAG